MVPYLAQFSLTTAKAEIGNEMVLEFYFSFRLLPPTQSECISLRAWRAVMRHAWFRTSCRTVTRTSFEMQCERTTESCTSETPSIPRSVQRSDCSMHRQSQATLAMFTLAFLFRSDAYFQNYSPSHSDHSLSFGSLHGAILNHHFNERKLEYVLQNST